jgi:hypothetical protein
MGLRWKCLRTALFAILAFHAYAQERHYRALVIGNERYGSKALPWAAAGARDVAKRLTELRYEVSAETDVGKRDLSGSIARFREEIGPGDVVVFYYAGRATRSGDDASLVPVDDIEPGRDLSIDLRGIVNGLGAKHAAATLIVLDVLAEQPVFGFEIGAKWLPLLPAPRAGMAILASARENPGVLTRGLLNALRRRDEPLAAIVRQVEKSLPARSSLFGTLVARERFLGSVAGDVGLSQSEGRLAPAVPADTNTPGPTPMPTSPTNPAGRAAPAATPPPAPVTALKRFPTVDAPPSVSTGVRFSVLVSLTTEKLTPEVQVPAVGKGVEKTAAGGLALNLPCRPKCEMEVVLAAPGFDFVSGSNTAGIEMTADGDSTPARFELSALQAGSGRLEATFWYQGAFLARAVRTIQVTAIGAARAPTSAVAPMAAQGVAAAPVPPGGSVASRVSQPPGPAALPFGARPPDLTVRWEESTFGNQQHCIVMVSSPYLGPVKSAPCVPGADLARYLAERYQQLHELTGRGVQVAGGPAKPQDRSRLIADDLRGLGRELYDHFATRAFQDAFWALIDKQRADPGFEFRTIQIYTNNPVLPWEILVPARPDGSGARGFLGVDFDVARWHIGDRIQDLPPLELNLRRIVAFAPQYQGAAFLAHQREELQSMSSLPGYEQDAGNTQAMFQLLDDPPEGIVHFAGHGYARPATGGGMFDYGLQFEDAAVSPTVWRGHERPSTRNHPLFVLNACDTGEAQNVAGFIDGWASVLLETGASGFIGGLWPLGDQGAAEFAKEFYQGLQKNLSEGKAAPVADLLRKIRADFTKTSDPTFLAYVFYGDARLEIVP